jgi:flagellar secretion chaperone FliS
MQGVAAYKENAVLTASPGRLVVLLYEGAINFLRKAIIALGEKDYMAKNHYIGKACQIIQELNLTLDMEKGGEIATNLRSLYNFMQRHLTQANLSKDPQKIQHVIDLLNDLLSGWRTVASQDVQI